MPTLQAENSLRHLSLCLMDFSSPNILITTNNLLVSVTDAFRFRGPRGGGDASNQRNRTSPSSLSSLGCAGWWSFHHELFMNHVHSHGHVLHNEVLSHRVSFEFWLHETNYHLRAIGLTCLSFLLCTLEIVGWRWRLNEFWALSAVNQTLLFLAPSSVSGWNLNKKHLGEFSKWEPAQFRILSSPLLGFFSGLCIERRATLHHW